ncbi:type II toxin-antitoxin system Phd/YefM family antitoxin [Eubacteriales bacterium SGI.150]|uniref:type II toxin-antitoxin system Phd/YefM family antitoxin n=1 Tax=Intestinimonas sp. TaxID=1965293 RepID=UPI002A9178B4|nr:type II toxin-antitoxin system Phd/YefM family antitoxin [Intestinimonas sp.]MDY5339440.1 type II toxin-antitoxin system Phd/YefM family antitoxin [Intestinimonas sp.]
MMIDTAQIITVTEANQNFSRATRIADEKGAALVFKNNRPKYKLTNLEVEPDLQLTDDEKIDVVARRIMARFKPAFLELAK